MNRGMIGALIMDLAGTLLIVLGVLGYTGDAESIHPVLGEPGGYLTCGLLGLVLTAIAIPRLIRALRAKAQADRPGT